MRYQRQQLGHGVGGHDGGATLQQVSSGQSDDARPISFKIKFKSLKV